MITGSPGVSDRHGSGEYPASEETGEAYGDGYLEKWWMRMNFSAVRGWQQEHLCVRKGSDHFTGSVYLCDGAEWTDARKNIMMERKLPRKPDDRRLAMQNYPRCIRCWRVCDRRNKSTSRDMSGAVRLQWKSILIRSLIIRKGDMEQQIQGRYTVPMPGFMWKMHNSAGSKKVEQFRRNILI